MVTISDCHDQTNRTAQKHNASVNTVGWQMNLYITIGLSRCVTTGVAWMDRRSRAAGTGSKWRATGRNRRLWWRKGRGLRGARVQAGRVDGQADGPNRAQIARLWFVKCNNWKEWRKYKRGMWGEHVPSICWSDAGLRRTLPIAKLSTLTLSFTRVTESLSPISIKSLDENLLKANNTSMPHTAVVYNHQTPNSVLTECQTPQCRMCQIPNTFQIRVKV